MRTFLKAVLIVTIISSGIAGLSLSSESNDPIAKAFENLPQDEKEDFLSYFLGLGLIDWTNDLLRPPKNLPAGQAEALISSLNVTEANIKKFQEMNIPKESRKKLVRWVKTEFSLASREVLQLIKTKQCQGAVCVSLADIGDICCPW